MKINNVLSTCIIAFLLSNIAYSQSQDSSSSAEQEIRDCLLKIKQAAETLDSDSLFSLVLENNKGASVEDGHFFLTRTQALNFTKRRFQGVKEVKYEFDQEHITMLSDDLALVVSDGKSHCELEDGRIFDSRFSQTVILKRVEGKWKILHAHSSIPPRR